jgi:hypothetical protein
VKITDFKIIEAASIEQLTELVKAELPAWSVIGSLEVERIQLTYPTEEGKYSDVIFRICLGLEQPGIMLQPMKTPNPRIIEGASAAPNPIG